MKASQLARYGLLTTVMLVLGFIERQFVLVPSVPGIKLGLPNTVLVYIACIEGAGPAFLLMLLKVLLSALLFGNFTGLVYALFGGILSVSAMLLISRWKGIGVCGVSICGAVLHMPGQMVASRVLLGSWVMLTVLPYLLAAGAIAGVLTGVAAQGMIVGLAHNDAQLKEKLIARGWYRKTTHK